ncbi:4Fe-4S binding protein [Cyclobacteriaceae bacterium]|nr:4Fe-4S binding protein [Cyclobacteriaceae bacterium]
MQKLQNIGLGIFVFSLLLFTSTVFIGEYELTEKAFDQYVDTKNVPNESFVKEIKENVIGVTYSNVFEASSSIIEILERTNQSYIAKQEWGKVFWDKPHTVAYTLLKPSALGSVAQNQWRWFVLTFGLGIFGSLLFVFANIKLLGAAGIKNNHIYQSAATNKGWVAWLVLTFLVAFYIVLYFFPDFIVNWVLIVDPVAQTLFGSSASEWFLYGFLYTIVMTVMGIRMIIKYRDNKYQVARTITVVFFQIIFAFLIVNILPLFNLPGVDLKNAWPLDYSFLYEYRIEKFFLSPEAGGHVEGAIFILFWGAFFSLVVIPVLVYFFGKRWYCSWVCGCGGLAETLGDPYRQLSDKRLIAWKVERWMIYSVLVFAILMTIWTGVHSYKEITSPGEGGNEMFFGFSAFDIRQWYGFLIGSVFSGIIGTGFYPIMGNRVWCRFGCPLAAYMGIVQRFKSRFRITTNGGQCISCGNCSTYCEQGIDVRWYAQRQQNIVRSSCVGCGVCSAVCPRGVLKLENAPEENRFDIRNLPSIKK